MNNTIDQNGSVKTTSEPVNATVASFEEEITQNFAMRPVTTTARIHALLKDPYNITGPKTLLSQTAYDKAYIYNLVAGLDVTHLIEQSLVAKGSFKDLERIAREDEDLLDDLQYLILNLCSKFVRKIHKTISKSKPVYYEPELVQQVCKFVAMRYRQIGNSFPKANEILEKIELVQVNFRDVHSVNEEEA